MLVLVKGTEADAVKAMRARGIDAHGTTNRDGQRHFPTVLLALHGAYDERVRAWWDELAWQSADESKVPAGTLLWVGTDAGKGLV